MGPFEEVQVFRSAKGVYSLKCTGAYSSCPLWLYQSEEIPDQSKDMALWAVYEQLPENRMNRMIWSSYIQSYYSCNVPWSDGGQYFWCHLTWDYSSKSFSNISFGTKSRFTSDAWWQIVSIVNSIMEGSYEGDTNLVSGDFLFESVI